jgi:hypothetical protein
MKKRLASLVLVALSYFAASVRADESMLTQDYYLFTGQNLASGCKYRLTMQTDGNLVLYDWSNRAIWSASTTGRGAYAVMQNDGNFVIYDWSNRAVWDTRTRGALWAHLVLQGDRNLVVYDSDGVARWNSRTANNSGIGVSISPCSWNAAKTGMWRDWDTAGEYLRHFVMNSISTPQFCASSCADDASCGAFTWVPAGVQGARPVCWLKKNLGGWVPRTGMYSGVVERVARNGGNL